MSREEILAEIQAASPQDPQQLDKGRVQMLQLLTQRLLTSDPDGAAAYNRFALQNDKGLPFNEDAMSDHVSGKRILITGGNGCIGSVLSTELSRFAPASIVALGTATVAASCHEGHVRSEYADIRNRRSLREKFDAIRPDIVYHLAGQRNVGAAEKGLWDTLETNILGTQNVIDLAQLYGTHSLVYASSEKALPPYVADAYSVSKKASEWLLSNTVEPQGMAPSIARLAHITDNSVIFSLIRQWAEQNLPIKLFSANTSFHVQTALGAAHTLMVAGLEATALTAKLFAVSELGEPVNLVNAALGVLAVTGSQSPIYFSPSIPGYESIDLPPIFRHVDNPDTMPLVGQFELARAKKTAACGEVVAMPTAATNREEVSEVIARIRAPQESSAASLKSDLSWALLDSILGALDESTLREALGYYEMSPAASLNEPECHVIAAIRSALKAR